jgi:hypothetical protein
MSHNLARLRDLSVYVTFEPLHWPNPAEDIHRFAVEFALSAHLNR